MIAIENKIRNLILELSYYQKKELFHFLESILHPPTKSNSLLQFAGAINLEDVEQMEKVIEEGNKIDEDEW
ncbi:hypothetical protein [Bernardetia sp.]|uniref:hypothetical protein n=1 Tax=Bernardetia sp. TaxID=1937974 RepID=UPI0025B7F656|nr:hypothetical protein [Bernardetia sp.]